MGRSNFVQPTIALRLENPNDGKVIVLKLGGSDMPKPKEERYVSQRGGNKYVQLGGNQIQGKQILTLTAGHATGLVRLACFQIRNILVWIAHTSKTW